MPLPFEQRQQVDVAASRTRRRNGVSDANRQRERIGHAPAADKLLASLEELLIAVRARIDFERGR